MLLLFCLVYALTVVAVGVKLFVWPSPAFEGDYVERHWKEGVPPLLVGSQGSLDKARGNFGRLWNWRVEREAGQDPVRVFSACILFLVLTAILPFLFLTGFSMKAEVATEIFTGSQGVQPWTLNLGFATFPVTIVNVVAAGMVLAEMILGIALHYTGERLHQARTGDGRGEEGTFKTIRVIAIIFMVLVVCLEGMFGVFRGQIEAQGELIPTVGMVGISVVLSVITIITSYFWKSNLASLMVPLRWILMVVGWVGNCPWVAVTAGWWFCVRATVFLAYLVALGLEQVVQSEDRVKIITGLVGAALILVALVLYLALPQAEAPSVPVQAAEEVPLDPAVAAPPVPRSVP